MKPEPTDWPAAEETVERLVGPAQAALKKQAAARERLLDAETALVERILAQIGPDLLPFLCETVPTEMRVSAKTGQLEAAETYEAKGILVGDACQTFKAVPEGAVNLKGRRYYLTVQSSLLTEGERLVRGLILEIEGTAAGWSTKRSIQCPLRGLLEHVRMVPLVNAIVSRLNTQIGRERSAKKLERQAKKLEAILALLEPQT